jgi:hypothetical protein
MKIQQTWIPGPESVSKVTAVDKNDSSVVFASAIVFAWNLVLFLSDITCYLHFQFWANEIVPRNFIKFQVFSDEISFVNLGIGS